MSLNSRFQKDPVDFAQRYSLHPQGNRTSQAAAAAQFQIADLKAKDLGAGDSFLQVRGTNRILYCNITQGGAERDAGLSNLDTRQDGNICSMDFSPAPQGRSAFPVFWLPWTANKAIRVMLKTSKHETKTAGIMRRTVEPRMFVTAALSGCSIFVEGDRDQPIVYHLNANSVSPGPIGAPYAPLHARVDNKMQTMEARYRQISTAAAHSKVPAGQQGSMSADMSMYMGAELSAPGAAQRLGVARQQVPVQHGLPALFGAHGNVKDVSQLQTLATFGTVFGKKGDDGQWTFYQQSRTRAQYYAKINPRGADNDYANWELRARWVALSCREFWPNGARQIQR